MGLQKKKVIVIGGSGGIGRATAQRALDAGAAVVIAGRTEEHLEEARNVLGGYIESAIIDVRDTRGMEQVLDELAPFDHLVFTAADVHPAPFLEIDLDQAKEAFEVKFWGEFAAAQHAAAHLREGGSITFISGVSAHQPVPGMSIIAAINGATEALVRSLAVELAPLRVNAVCPGLIDTHGLSPERREALAGNLPARKVGEADHVAHAVLFLMENAFTTGAIVFVDGGNTLV